MTERTLNQALNRVIEVFQAKPAVALDTDKTSARLEKGLQCQIRQGDLRVTADMAKVLGGGGSSPSPGFFGRAALVSCIAIGIKMTAAVRQVAIDAIDVEVEMDWDNRGLFGIDDISAGCMGIRLKIVIQSPAAEEELQAVVAQGLRNDPWLLLFKDPQHIDTQILIRRSPAEVE